MAKVKHNQPVVSAILKDHFGGLPLHELASASREFPVTNRLDLQAALAEVLSAANARLLGFSGVGFLS